MKILCYMGFHRNFVHEDSSYKRVVTEFGENIDAVSVKRCQCGAVIESQVHSVSRTTVPEDLDAVRVG